MGIEVSHHRLPKFRALQVITSSSSMLGSRTHLEKHPESLVWLTQNPTGMRPPNLWRLIT